MTFWQILGFPRATIIGVHQVYVNFRQLSVACENCYQLLMQEQLCWRLTRVIISPQNENIVSNNIPIQYCHRLTNQSTYSMVYIVFMPISSPLLIPGLLCLTQARKHRCRTVDDWTSVLVRRDTFPIISSYRSDSCVKETESRKGSNLKVEPYWCLACSSKLDSGSKNTYDNICMSIFVRPYDCLPVLTPEYSP